MPRAKEIGAMEATLGRPPDGVGTKPAQSLHCCLVRKQGKPNTGGTAMKTRHLLAALLAVLALATAAPATAATKIVVERIESLSSREPLEDEGGGYPGCWRAYVHAWGSHWSGSTWNHHFNPAWCGNGWVVTSVDP